VVRCLPSSFQQGNFCTSSSRPGGRAWSSCKLGLATPLPAGSPGPRGDQGTRSRVIRSCLPREQAVWSGEAILVAPGPGQEPSSQRGRPEPDHDVRVTHTHHRPLDQLVHLHGDLPQLIEVAQHGDDDHTDPDDRPEVGLEPTAGPRPRATTDCVVLVRS
jgi:hypothetical protein